MISRRRFICISAAGLACGPAEAAAEWRGFALGAETRILLRRAPAQAERIFQAVSDELARIEGLFSLYDPSSALSRLNAARYLEKPAADFVRVCALSDLLHQRTGGRFDPSVQALWQAHAREDNPEAAAGRVDWSRVTFDARAVRLGPGQSLTFNGIAQGFATDRVSALLREYGLGDILVNMGEHRAMGGPFALALHDPMEGQVATLALTDRAVATSSAMSDLVGGQSHILGPDGSMKPLWSTVSVEADEAGIADGASTAFVLMPREDILAAMKRLPQIHVVHLVSTRGRYERLTKSS